MSEEPDMMSETRSRHNNNNSNAHFTLGGGHFREEEELDRFVDSIGRSKEKEPRMKKTPQRPKLQILTDD